MVKIKHGDEVTTVKDLIDDSINSHVFRDEGRLETLDDKVILMQELVTNLIDVLLGRSVLTPEDLRILIGSTEEIEILQPPLPPLPPTKINYIWGDATEPQGEGNIIIPHICNDIGVWGAGFVLALSKRWKGPERVYRENHNADRLLLGSVQFVQVEETIWVANMIAQRDVKSYRRGSGPPIRYDALKDALSVVADKARSLNASVHMPRIGAGLAGGDWQRIELIIEQTLIDEGIDVTVYNFGL